LTGILGGTFSLRPSGLTRENDEQAAGEDIFIRDGATVVVTVSEDGRPAGAHASPNEECGGGIQVRTNRTAGDLINKTNKVEFR
jgi:hypothetical protein